MGDDNLTRARGWIERALKGHVGDFGPQLGAPPDCGPTLLVNYADAVCLCAAALAAAVREKGVADAAQTIERDLGRTDQGPLTAWELRAAIRAYAADVPEVPRAG